MCADRRRCSWPINLLVAPRKDRWLVFTESELRHHQAHVATPRVAPSGQRARSAQGHTANRCEGRPPDRSGHVPQVRGMLAERADHAPAPTANGDESNGAKSTSGLPVYLMPRQVAAMLQVDERTVLRWAQQDASMP